MGRARKLGFVVGAATISALAASLGMMMEGLSMGNALIFGAIIYMLCIGIDMAIRAVWG